MPNPPLCHPGALSWFPATLARRCKGGWSVRERRRVRLTQGPNYPGQFGCGARVWASSRPTRPTCKPQTVPHGGADAFLLCAPRATLPVPPYTSPYYTHFHPRDPESDGAFPSCIGIQLPLGPKAGFAGSRSWLVWPRECPDPGSLGPDSWGYLGVLGGHLT